MAKRISQDCFDFSKIPPKLQFEVYADLISQIVIAMHIEKLCDRTDFPMTINTVTDEQHRCVSTKSFANSVHRTPTLIKQKPANELNLGMLLYGSAIVNNPDSQMVFRPNQLVVFYSDTPHEIIARTGEEEYHLIAINIPFDTYQDKNLKPENIHGKAVNGHEYAPLLRLTLSKLAHAIEENNDAITPKLFSIATSLVELVVTGTYVTNPGPYESHAYNLIEIEIIRNLQDSGLDVDRVCYNLGMSKDRVSQILADHNTSFSTLVSEHRVALAKSLLTTPAQKDNTIEMIAKRSGFKSIKDFCAAMSRSSIQGTEKLQLNPTLIN